MDLKQRQLWILIKSLAVESFKIRWWAGVDCTCCNADYHQICPILIDIVAQDIKLSFAYNSHKLIKPATPLVSKILVHMGHLAK